MSDAREALAVLMRSRGRALTAYSFVLCRDWEEAQDITQEALVKCLLQHNKLRDPGNLEAYVRATIQHEYFDRKRRSGLFDRFRHLLSSDGLLISEDHRIELKVDVDRALAQLTSTQRLMVVMYYYDDLSVRSISRTLKCSEGNVKRHLSDARRRLAALSAEAEPTEVTK